MCFQEVLKVLQGRSLKGVSRQFQRRCKEVSRVLKESVKFVSRNFQKQFQGHFKNVSMKFCCMELIAATRAEGGLVCLY